MTIIQAMKSGRPFKRKRNTQWYTVDNMSRIQYLSPGLSTLTPFIDAKDILTDDWEIEPARLSLSGDDVRAAAQRLAALEHNAWNVENLITELGL